MLVINESKILNQVAKLHANAKDGQLKFNDEVYQLFFNRAEGVYDVIEGDGSLLLRYNTRSLKQASQWLKEFLSN